MAQRTMLDMLKSGVHFGHKTRYWNPKMASYIYGARHGVHIINLEKTVECHQDATNFLSSLAAKNATILFVGTKMSALKIIAEHAERANMPYINHRWLGGLLTNYRTVRQSVKRLKELEAMVADGSISKFTKKEGLQIRREIEKLERSIGGIKNMAGLPDALFVVDVEHERIAISEANKLGIPVIALVDTNSNPENIDYIIPSNDDGARAINLFVESAVDAIITAREAANVVAPEKTAEVEEEKEDDKQPRPKVVIKRQSKKADEAEADKKEPAKKKAAKAEAGDKKETKAKKEDGEKAKPAAKKATTKKAASKEEKVEDAKAEPKKAPAKKAATKKADKEEAAKEEKKPAKTKAATKDKKEEKSAESKEVVTEDSQSASE